MNVLEAVSLILTLKNVSRAIKQVSEENCHSLLQQLLILCISGPCIDPSCEKKHDGMHVDEYQGCQRFYSCNANQITNLESCKRGYLYNGISCEIAESVKCSPNIRIKKHTDIKL